MYPGHSSQAPGVQVWASLPHPPPWVPLTTCSFSTPKAEPEQASPEAAKGVGALPPGGLELDPVHRRSPEGMLRCDRKDFQGALRWGGPYNQGPSTMATWELLLPGPACLCPQVVKPRHLVIDSFLIHSGHPQRKREYLPQLKIWICSLPDNLMRPWPIIPMVSYDAKGGQTQTHN